jgi:hypothetical protein
MKILGENCHGLGNTAAILALLDVQKRHNPDVVFLLETHLDTYPADCLKRRMKMDFKVVQPSDGRRGGLALFWKKEIKLTLLFSDPNYIDVSITEGELVWRFTGMYGEFRWADKYKIWDMFRNLHQI